MEYSGRGRGIYASEEQIHTLHTHEEADPLQLSEPCIVKETPYLSREMSLAFVPVRAAFEKWERGSGHQGNGFNKEVQLSVNSAETPNLFLPVRRFTSRLSHLLCLRKSLLESLRQNGKGPRPAAF